jgi:hypothetical protein
MNWYKRADHEQHYGPGGFSRAISPGEGLTVADIVRMWRDKNEKIHEMSMPYMMDADDLWNYREYDWGRENNRYMNTEYWDELAASMKNGWDKNRPLWLTVGKDGVGVVGEGNHRLAIFRQLGNPTQVPVRISFNKEVNQNDDASRITRVD